MTETSSPESERQPDAETAFLVFRRPDGDWEATADIDRDVFTQRTATVADMRTGCAEVVSDIDASKVATMAATVVVQEMMRVTSTLQQQAQAQALREKLRV